MGAEVIESGFRARAGTLTLLLVTSPGPRDYLLELLVEASLGIPIDEERAQAWRTADRETAALEAGAELPYVAFTLDRWLCNAPHGPLRLASHQGGEAAIGMICGWASKVTHLLAREPLGLDDLDRAIPLERDHIENQLATMRSARLIEPIPGGRDGTRYRVTDWLREAIAPLAAAARLERHQHHEDTAPPDELDVEAAFRLTLPLLALPVEPSGSCRLAVRMSDDTQAEAGVMAQIEEGHVICCDTQLEDEADTWATGSPIGWMDTLVEPSTAQVEAGGNQELALALVGGLHEKLFGVPVFKKD